MWNPYWVWIWWALLDNVFSQRYSELSLTNVFAVQNSSGSTLNIIDAVILENVQAEIPSAILTIMNKVF